MSNAVTNAFVQSFVADMVKNKVAPPVQVVKHGRASDPLKGVVAQDALVGDHLCVVRQP